MEITPPDCSTDTRTPCTEKDWTGCAVCGHLVCLVHDDLTTVYHAEEKSYGFDEVCSSCIDALYETGEISMGADYRYVNRR
jgi:hypothetical protein